MNMRLEVVIVPVSNVDRAKAFYEKLGFRLDIDYKGDDDFRIVHFTPPGSACSILFGNGVTDASPGSIHDLVLVVDDIEVAHEHFTNRDIDAGEIYHDSGGVFRHVSDKYKVSGFDPDRNSYSSFISFKDPDGNGWLVQEITERLPGR